MLVLRFGFSTLLGYLDGLGEFEISIKERN